MKINVNVLITVILLDLTQAIGFGADADDIQTAEFWNHKVEIIRDMYIEAKKCRIVPLTDLSEIYSAKNIYRFTKLGGLGCVSIVAVESPEKQKALLVVTHEEWDSKAGNAFLTIREYSMKWEGYIKFVTALRNSGILTIPEIAPSKQSYDGGFDDLPTGIFESLVEGEYKRRVRIQMIEEVVEDQFFTVAELFKDLWFTARGIKPLPRGPAGPFK